MIGVGNMCGTAELWDIEWISRITGIRVEKASR